MNKMTQAQAPATAEAQNIEDSLKRHRFQADLASSRGRGEAESISSTSDKLGGGTSPKIRAGQHPVAICNLKPPSGSMERASDTRGSDIELTQSLFSASSSPPLLLPPPFRSAAMHGSKGSTSADTLGDSDAVTLDGAGGRSGCEEDDAAASSGQSSSHPLRPLHSAPARVAETSRCSNPAGDPGGGSAADDMDEYYWAWTPSIMNAYGFPVLRPHTMREKPRRSERKRAERNRLVRTLTEPVGASPEKAAADLVAIKNCASSSTPLSNPRPSSRTSASSAGPSHDLHLSADPSDMSLPERTFSPSWHYPSHLPPAAQPAASSQKPQASAARSPAVDSQQHIQSFAVAEGKDAQWERSPPVSSRLERSPTSGSPEHSVPTAAGRVASIVPGACSMQPSPFAPSSCDSEGPAASPAAESQHYPAPRISASATPQKLPHTQPDPGSVRRPVQAPMHSPSVSLFGNDITATVDAAVPLPEAMPTSGSSSSSPWTLSPHDHTSSSVAGVAACTPDSQYGSPVGTTSFSPQARAKIQQVVHSDMETSARLSEGSLGRQEDESPQLAPAASHSSPFRGTAAFSPPDSPRSPKSSALVSVKDWMSDSESIGEPEARCEAPRQLQGRSCAPRAGRNRHASGGGTAPSISAFNLVGDSTFPARSSAYPAQRPASTGAIGMATPTANGWPRSTQHSVELSPRMPCTSEGGTPSEMTDSESIPLAPAIHSSMRGERLLRTLAAQPLQPSPPLSAPSRSHPSPPLPLNPSSSPPLPCVSGVTLPSPPPLSLPPMSSTPNSSAFGTPCMSDHSKSASSSYATVPGGSASSCRSTPSFFTAPASTARSPLLSPPPQDPFPQFSFPTPEEVASGARALSPVHSYLSASHRTHATARSSSGSSDTESSAQMLGGLAPLDTEAVFFDGSAQLEAHGSRIVAEAGAELGSIAGGDTSTAGVDPDADEESSGGEEGQLRMRRISSATFGEAIHIHDSDLGTDSGGESLSSEGDMPVSGTPREDPLHCIELSPSGHQAAAHGSMFTGGAASCGQSTLACHRLSNLQSEAMSVTDSMGMGAGGDTLAVMMAYASTTDFSNMHPSLLSGGHASMLSTGPHAPAPAADAAAAAHPHALTLSDIQLAPSQSNSAAAEEDTQHNHLVRTSQSPAEIPVPTVIPRSQSRGSNHVDVQADSADMWGIGHVARGQQASPGRAHPGSEGSVPPLLPLAVLLQQGQDEDADDERGSSGLESEDEDSGPLHSVRMLGRHMSPRRLSPRLSPRSGSLRGPGSPLMADALSGMPLAPILEESAHDVAPTTDAADTSRPLDTETAALSTGLSSGISGNMAERARAELAAVFARAAEAHSGPSKPPPDDALPKRTTSATRMLSCDVQHVGHLMGAVESSSLRPEAAQTMSTIHMGDVTCSQDIQGCSFMTEDSESNLSHSGLMLPLMTPQVVQAAAEPSGTFHRFKHVMADRANSVDLPQCIEGEEMTSSIAQGSSHTEQAAVHDSPASVKGRCREAPQAQPLMASHASPAGTAAESGTLPVGYGQSPEFLSYDCAGHGIDSIPSRRHLHASSFGGSREADPSHPAATESQLSFTSLPNTPGSAVFSQTSSHICTPFTPPTARSASGLTGVSNYTGVSYSTMPSPYPRYTFRYSQVEFNPEIVPEGHEPSPLYTSSSVANPIAAGESQCSKRAHGGTSSRTAALLSTSEIGATGESHLRNQHSNSDAAGRPDPVAEQPGGASPSSRASPMLSPSGRWVPAGKPLPSQDVEQPESGLEAFKRAHPGESLLTGSWPEGHVSWYVQHWDLTDAVIVVEQPGEGGEEDSPCGISPEHAERSNQNAEHRHRYPDADGGCQISSVLTDGDGADSHLSSHFTSHFTTPCGSHFTAKSHSSQPLDKGLASLLNPLSRATAAGATEAAAGHASPSQRLQPTDPRLPETTLAASATPHTAAAIQGGRQQQHEPPASDAGGQPDCGVHHGHTPSMSSSAAAAAQAAATTAAADPRMRVPQQAAEGGAIAAGRCSSAHVPPRAAEHEFSVDIDVTDALMSKDLSKAQASSSTHRRVPQLPEDVSVPSFVDDDGLSVALEAHCDKDFGSPRGEEEVHSRHLDTGGGVLVNSLWNTFGTMPADMGCTVDSQAHPRPAVQQASQKKKSSWKGTLLRALGTKSSKADDKDGAGAARSSTAPVSRPSSKFLPAMLTSIGSNTGRRGRSKAGARGDHMFNTTGTDIMETAQSDWAFHTVGAHPYSMAPPSSMGATSTVASQPHEGKQKKRRWWRSLGRTR